MIISPVTHSKNVVKLRSIDTAYIIGSYKKQFNYDVTYLFSNLKIIDYYECLDTGYRFFYPPIEGDSKFYECLSQNDWYYMPNKWEHQKALKLLKPTDKVLEVGCGRGDFIKSVKKIGNEIVGLELNKKAVQYCISKGLNVFAEDVKTHLEKGNKYDVVFLFQVFEHISDVRDVFMQVIKILNVGGKIVLSVPNNESFIKFADTILNMPPHHVGHWGPSSLKKLPDFFAEGVFGKIYYEPLQEYHKSWYINVMLSRLGLIGKLIYRFFKSIALSIISLFSIFIKGHTVLVVYGKK